MKPLSDVDSERELLIKIVCGFSSAPCNHPDKVRKTFYSLKRKGLIEPLVLKGVVRKGYVATDQGILLCRKEQTND